ncbi:PP2C family protein-serine/threonine phosphatase [Nocardioides coralli]|uniref:PP2C family protein-serine/threonine phosphatase n=1 Tax=Nocardioides coralli TaxID=2872154 RepID=UPI001CA4659F|nr:PP2C family protein-serine/threonine phosphatase [Nocardioides coralli]QZY28289.1 serine/threonine-protein phosphatase [Nocardioides coralli]
MSQTSGPRVRSRSARAFLRRSSSPEARTLRLLVVFSLVIAVLVWFLPSYAPLTLLILPMLLGSLNLGPRPLPWFVVFLLLLLVLLLARQPEINPRLVAAIGVIFAAGFIILLTSFRRSRLGVGGAQGESMLVDLRDRILSQSSIPPLPLGFHAETALRSAGGTPFAGDFMVAVRPKDDTRLEVAVVDVSGKGEEAGTRALLLAGALGGLIGALPPAEFLPAANDYLLRQDWEEGFATAIHLSLDLTTGAYEMRSAGHPPAAHRAAGSGRWSLRSDPGPALGLLDTTDFPVTEGVLRSGDAILLYTDGLVETPDKDMNLGIDRMLGQADQLLRGDFEGGAERLIRALGSRYDDRALALVYRR